MAEFTANGSSSAGIPGTALVPAAPQGPAPFAPPAPPAPRAPLAPDGRFPVIRPVGVAPRAAGPLRAVGDASEQKPRVAQLDLGTAAWQSSTQGDGEVQIAFVEGFVAMRDGRDPDGPALVFTPGEWRAFVLGARDGEFDLT